MKAGEFKMSVAEREKLNQRLRNMTDDEIDYSDIPKLTQKDWEKAVTYAQYNKQNNAVG